MFFLLLLSSLSAQASECSNFEEVEDTAMLGMLETAQKECLENKIKSAEDRATKQKISKILIMNAQQSKDYAQWEQYVHRHLKKFDQSDANMCMGFSIFMFKKKRYGDSILWAEKSLEHRQNLSSGSDFKKKVYNLHKIRTMAANSLWKTAEANRASRTEDDLRNQKITQSQKRTKTFARAWLDYAKESGQSTSLPLQICVSAADAAYCK